MVRPLLIAASLLVLQACDREGSVDEANKERAGERAQGAADPNALAAGRWETKQDIRSVAKADLDAGQKNEIRNTAASLDQCLPPEEAKRPDANFFAGGDASECEYTRFSMQDGKLSAAMSCTLTPGTITLVLNGTYTPTSYSLDATATSSGIPDAPMRTTAKLTGTWLGQCRADEADQRAPEDPARVPDDPARVSPPTPQ